MRDRQRVCPNCGSTDIDIDRTDIISRMALSQSYICSECGYSGIFPEVDADQVDSHRDAARHRKDLTVDDTADGTGFRAGRLIAGVLFLAVGIPAALYGSWGSGLLAGLLSILIGGAVVFEQLEQLL